ncbi:MAG: hypothetical protein K6G90_10310 [Clostridia bacterium]|nr:hypothetical protein [Clostridia bacterium]
MKKVISLLLAVIMILSVASIVVNAEDPAPAPFDLIATREGDTVTLSLVTNAELTYANVTFELTEPAGFTLTAIQKGGDFGDFGCSISSNVARRRVSLVTADDDYDTVVEEGKEFLVFVLDATDSETQDRSFSLKVTTAADINGKSLPWRYDVIVSNTLYEDGMGERLIGYTISLDGDIGVNFYMELSESIAESETAKMHFTIPSGGKTFENDVYVSEARVVERGNRTYHVFKCRVAAKEMTSEIKAQMIDGDQTGTEYVYSVKEYADYLIDHASEDAEYAAAVPLVKALLNYGARAQIHFDKTSTGLANADLTEDEKALGTPDISVAAPIVDLPDGVTLEGATLSLKSETSLSFYFKSSEELTFSCEGYEVEKAASGSYQIARIRGINAKDIGNVFTLKVNESGSVTYSPLNYCKTVLDDETQPDELKDVVKALYFYWQAAVAYFE